MRRAFSSEPQASFLVAMLVGDPRPLLSDDDSRRALAKGESMGRTLALFGPRQIEVDVRCAEELRQDGDVGRCRRRPRIELGELRGEPRVDRTGRAPLERGDRSSRACAARTDV